MAVAVKGDGAAWEAGRPVALFEPRLTIVTLRNRYVVTGDGQRFLVNAVVESTDDPIEVALNWRPPAP